MVLRLPAIPVPRGDFPEPVDGHVSGQLTRTKAYLKQPYCRRKGTMQIIATHKNTDFDALASVVAALCLYPDAAAVLPNALNPNVRKFVSLHKDRFNFCISRKVDFEKTDGLIVVDTNSWGRLDGVDSLRAKPGVEIHVFDHHDGEGDIVAGWCCRETTGANITLMLRCLNRRKIPISSIEATLFLLGLYEDTGNLTFPSTTAEDVRAAACLLEHGADLNMLDTFLGQTYNRRQKDILFGMLQTAKSTTISGVTVSIILVEVKEHVENLAMVVQACRQILDVDLLFGIFILPGDRSLVIGRSGGDAIHIGNLMRTMGGGGHTGAGSAMVKSVNPQVIAARIRILIGGNVHGSRQVLDLMNSPVFSLSITTTMGEAYAALRQRGHHGAPVVDDNRIVGVLSLRDFRKIRKKDHYKLTVKAFMSTEVVVIGPDESAARAAQLMTKYDIGRLPVLEQERLVGIITRSDAMHDLYGYCSIDKPPIGCQEERV
jgi:nanoRNase/pAp phosphatase (c-di-AMP/oligoRNAs hydrolase)/CBS domain-containing protein